MRRALDGSAWAPLVFALSLELGAHMAAACDFCKFDRATTVYSYSSQEWARRTRNTYVEVRVQWIRDPAQARKIATALRSEQRIFSDTVRVSYAQSAASFVYKGETSFDEIASALSRRLRGVSLRRIEPSNRA